MFNKNVTDILGEVNKITNSVILRYPKTIAVSEAQDIMVQVDFSLLDSDEFPEIGLKDTLSEFLSLFKLFGDKRKVSIDGTSIIISDGNINSSYISSDIVLMDAYDKDETQISKTEDVPTVAQFDLDLSDLKQLKDASSVFKDLSEILFRSQDNDVKISLAATNKFNARSNTFSINKTGDNVKTSKEFSIKIPVDNLKMLPTGAYTVCIKYNESRDAYRILMYSKALSGFKILLSVKV